MEIKRVTAILIVLILITTSLIWLVFNNEFVQRDGACLTEKELTLQCNEFCNLVEEEFCGHTAVICNKKSMSCQDLGLSCPYLDCSESIIKE